jgi:hypothetical protein
MKIMAWLNRFPVVLVLLFAICISALFYVGIGTRASLDFAFAASETLSELRNIYAAFQSGSAIESNTADFIIGLINGPGLSRLFQALSFQFAGINESAVTWLALATFLANCGLIFALIRRHASSSAALIASIAWAIFATMILSANQTIATGLSFTLFFSGLWLFSGNLQDLARVKKILIALLLVLLGIENSGFALAFLAHLIFGTIKQANVFRPLIFAFPLVILSSTDTSQIDFGKLILDLMREPALSLIMFAALISLVGLKHNRIKRIDLNQFAFLELLAIVVLPGILLGTGQNDALLAIAFVLLIPIAQYLAAFLDKEKYSLIGIAMISLLLIQAALLNMANMRTVPFPGAGTHNVLYLTLIFEGLLFVFWMASSAVLKWKKQLSISIFGFALIFLFMGSLMGQTAARTSTVALRNAAGRQAFAAIQELGAANSLAVLYDAQLRDQFVFLDSASSNKFGRIPILNAEEMHSTDKDWAIVWNHQQDFDNANWTWVQSFGLAGPNQISLFEQSSEPLQACNILDQSLRNEFPSEIEIQVIPIDLAQIETCYPDRNLVNQTEQLIFQTSGGAYIQPRWSAVDQTLATSLKYAHLLDPSIFSVQIDLAPNTAYIYSVEVRAEEPVTLLYWATKEYEGAYGGGRFSEWREFSLVLITPPWNQAQSVNFSPVLFDHFGEVTIRNFYLQELAIAP